MAIDGRDLVDPKPEKDGYESGAARAIGIAIVAVPAVLVLALAYWVGTWDIAGFKGGVLGGVTSVLITVGGAYVWWLIKKNKRRR